MQAIIVITPINQVSEAFKNTVVSVSKNLKNGDLWIIVIDNESQEIKEEINSYLLTTNVANKKYIILHSNYESGAGNARNYGLDYILKQKIKVPYILTFIDANDEYSNEFFKILRAYFKLNRGIVTYSYFAKSFNKTSEIKHKDRSVNYHNFLKNYCSSCLTTALLIDNVALLKKFRFGSRKRANDQLFFLSAVKNFGEIQLCSKIVATYNISKAPSLSNRKYKMPIYKFMALLDHGLSFHMACYFFCFYIIKSIKK